MKTENRKLAAILYADIVGYTSLMQDGETNALRILNRYTTVTNSIVEKYHGQIVKTYGDGSLITFESAIHSAKCAYEMQLAFKQEPQVPLRIGIHVGEFVIKGKDIFGNGVNIASRIESVGVAGSILMSKQVHEKIGNQEHLSTKSLGKFNFKNVKESIEVYALCNAGIVVPKSYEMKGKLAPTSLQTLYKYIPITVILSTLMLWQSGILDRWFDKNKIKDLRVAVLQFENKTNDESLEDFGTMVSDWLTRGLMETGEASVVSAANIKNQLQLAGIGYDLGGNESFVASTGVDILVQGRYYLEDDEIIIRSDIVNASTGDVLYAIKSIKGNQLKLTSLLDLLTSKLQAYWVVQNEAGISQNPPKYEAYQEYLKGGKYYRTEPDKSLGHFKKSFSLDSSFYSPLFGMANLYYNQNKDSLQRSILDYIGNSYENLTKHEQARYDYEIASHNGNYHAAAVASETIFLLDQSESKHASNAGSRYMMAGYSEKAINILNKIDSRFARKGREIDWRDSYKTMSYFHLNQYSKIIKTVEKYSFPKMYDRLATDHIRALVRLGDFKGLDHALGHYMTTDTYDARGTAQGPKTLLRITCIELEIASLQDILPTYINKLEAENEINPQADDYLSDLGYIHWFRKEYAQSAKMWTLEKVDLTDWFEVMSRIARISVSEIRAGQPENAVNHINEIFAVESIDPIATGVMHYMKAAIQANLMQKENAIVSLQKAESGGVPFLSYLYKGDVFLSPLFDYPAFEKFIEPKI